MRSNALVSGPTAGKEGLRGVIDRYEGDYAVLALDDGQRLLWPRGQLPAEAGEGVAVVVALTVDLMDTEQRLAGLESLQEMLDP